MGRQNLFRKGSKSSKFVKKNIYTNDFVQAFDDRDATGHSKRRYKKPRRASAEESRTHKPRRVFMSFSPMEIRRLEKKREKINKKLERLRRVI